MQNEITQVFGRKRSRKTRWTIRELKQRNRVIYIDPKSADLGRPEYDVGVECRTPAALRHYTERGGNFTVRIPTIDEDWINAICAQAVYVGNCTVVIDEVELFSDPNRGSAEGIYGILRAGGAAGVSFMGNAHRPADVDRAIISNADRIIVFQTTDDRSIDRLRAYLPVEPEVFMNLQAPTLEDPMRPSQYLEWRVDWGRNFKLYEFDEKKISDLEIHWVPDSARAERRERKAEGAEASSSNDGNAT